MVLKLYFSENIQKVTIYKDYKQQFRVTSVFIYIFEPYLIIMTQNFYSKTLKIVSVFAAVSFMLSSCKHKTNFEELTEVSYAGSIAPIMSSNCSFSGCHGDSAYVKISITNYNGLLNGGITPGSPEKSKLYSKIKSLDDDIMPKRPYNELTEKQIQLIYVWIGQGAKNN